MFTHYQTSEGDSPGTWEHPMETKRHPLCELIRFPCGAAGRVRFQVMINRRKVLQTMRRRW